MRKTLLCLAAFLLITSFAQAQIRKGTILLGGNIGASSSESKITSTFPSTQKSHGINVSPTLGFTIKDNLILGGGLNYGYGSASETNFKRTNNNYGAHIFMRKYLTLGKSFYLFGEGMVYFNQSESKDKTNGVTTSTTKVTSVGLGLYPGISYAVSNRFHLEVGLNNLANINFQKQKYTSGSNSSDSKSFNFGTSLSGSSPLTVGFRFLLGK